MVAAPAACRASCRWPGWARCCRAWPPRPPRPPPCCRRPRARSACTASAPSPARNCCTSMRRACTSCRPTAARARATRPRPNRSTPAVTYAPRIAAFRPPPISLLSSTTSSTNTPHTTSPAQLVPSGLLHTISSYPTVKISMDLVKETPTPPWKIDSMTL